MGCFVWRFPFAPLKVRLLGDLHIVCGSRHGEGTWLAPDGTKQIPAACMPLQCLSFKNSSNVEVKAVLSRIYNLKNVGDHRY